MGVIAFMLLLCLLSCVYRVHMRNEKDKRVILLAQQAGNKEGEAFRQVTSTYCITVFMSYGWRSVVGSLRYK